MASILSDHLKELAGFSGSFNIATEYDDPMGSGLWLVKGKKAAVAPIEHPRRRLLVKSVTQGTGL